MSGEISREVFERGHAAAALPYDPVRDEVVLIEQFRTGALAAGRGPWLTEVVAGMIEEGETPEAVVGREMREEAGIRSEEHTSELQSLMRISYAVFCLKKK